MGTRGDKDVGEIGGLLLKTGVYRPSNLLWGSGFRVCSFCNALAPTVMNPRT